MWLLAQLPQQSEIAVVDTRLGSPAAFQVDRGAATDRIAHLETVANSQPLPTAISAAAKLLRQSNLARKEMYVFTDLTSGAWPAERSSQIQQQLGELSDFGVYIVNVGIPKPTNCSLGEPRLSSEVLSVGSKLTVETTVSCVGPSATRMVELYLLDANREPQKRDEQSCDIAPGEMSPVEFRVGGLDLGAHQGYVRLVGQDGLAADDTRFFTVLVKPAARVLVAAAKPAQRNALTKALAAAGSRERNEARFDCEICSTSELGQRQLSDYAAVCLLDPPPLESLLWEKLANFAAEGHGVAIFLGHNAQPVDSFNEPPAQELLPGKLLRQVPRPDGDLHLAPRDYQHPILVPFHALSGAVPWKNFPVFRYWELDAAPAGATTVLPYSDGRPALLERPVGRGRVLTMTTPVSDEPGRNPWNLLPVGEPWPFLMLANYMMGYLTGGGDQQLNYFAGQTAVVLLDTAAARQGYMLFAPDGVASPYSADLDRHELPITTTDQVGNYRLQAGGARGVALGFSVNYAPEQTQLDRLTDKQLAALFGPVKFRLARTREQIDRNISMGRVGQELYPSLILIVALALALEMLVANRFYKE